MHTPDELDDDKLATVTDIRRAKWATRNVDHTAHANRCREILDNTRATAPPLELHNPKNKPTAREQQAINRAQTDRRNPQ
jgi:hypothetical protein